MFVVFLKVQYVMMTDVILIFPVFRRSMLLVATDDDTTIYSLVVVVLTTNGV